MTLETVDLESAIDCTLVKGGMHECVSEHVVLTVESMKGINKMTKEVKKNKWRLRVIR